MFGMPIRRALPGALVLVLALYTPARADKITLKDGRVLDGKIEREDAGSVTIRLQFGEMTVERDRIAKIEKGKTDLEVYAERAAALAPDDVAGHEELARWCEKAGLEKQSDEQWSLVIKADPANVEAKARGFGPDGEKKKEVAPEKEAAIEQEEAIRKRLSGTPIHFDFSRAPVEDILTAWGRATGMGIKLESEARKGLAKRKFTMNYQCTDRPADMVIDDIAKFAGLDYILKPDEVILSTPRRIRIIRREEGLPRSPQRLDADDVKDLLAKKRIDLELKDQTVRSLIGYIEKEGGIPVVMAGGIDLDQKITHRVFDVPLGEAIDGALGKAGLRYSIQGGTLYITKRGE